MPLERQPQDSQPTELMVTWTRVPWPVGKTKNKKFSTIENAMRFARALADGSKPGVAPVLKVEIRQRLVGAWVLVDVLPTTKARVVREERP